MVVGYSFLKSLFVLGACNLFLTVELPTLIISSLFAKKQRHTRHTISKYEYMILKFYL